MKEFLTYVDGIYRFFDALTPLLIILIPAVIYIYREKIRAYLRRDLLDAQQSSLQRLEIYKTSLIRELEEYKSSIDVRRTIQIEISQRRLSACQKALSALAHFVNHVTTYNSLEDPAARKKLREHQFLTSLNYLGILEQEYFYLPDNEHMKNAGAIMKEIVDYMSKNEIVPGSLVKELGEEAAALRLRLAEEMLPSGNRPERVICK